MLLRRLGNKKMIAREIIKHFPPHKFYIEPFFGTGSIFFQKKLSQYNYLNDIDGEVYNLYMQVRFNFEDLKREILLFPYHKDSWEWVKKQEFDDPLLKAMRFVILSNYGYLGNPNNIRYGIGNRCDLLSNF